MANTAAQDLMNALDDANGEQAGMYLSPEDVATLWDELLVLRGIRYRAHRSWNEALQVDYNMDAVAVARFIVGQQ